MCVQTLCPFKLSNIRLLVMADSTYDGIILGTGHNSLILQAYLCRAGLRVISLDRNTVPGAACAPKSGRSAPDSCTTPIRSTTEV